MSDVEKVEADCGASSDKPGRLTLKLDDKLRAAAPVLAKTSSTGRPFMTVEVRSKKKRCGGFFGGGSRNASVEKQDSSGVAGSLTAKEQLFRINAIHTADSISAKEEAARLAQQQEVAETKEEVVSDSVVPEQQGAAEDLGDTVEVADVPPTVDVKEGAAESESSTASHAAKGAGDRGAKKYSSNVYGSERNKEKKGGGGGAKKATSRVSSKHVKLDIEDALRSVDDRSFSRFSGGRRRGSNVRSDSRRISREVTIPDKIVVRDLAAAMAERVGNVLSELSRMSVEARAHTEIASDVACEVALKFGHHPKVESMAQMEKELSSVCEDDFELFSRPPVVAVMGHVDHGKTSLLDVLRDSNVAEKEFHGITQHIGAYQIDVDGKKITFLDTPGHEAFAEMRARGANVTDIVILVVAADDGIMPQTIESIKHVKASGVSMIVAVNKIDKSEANVAKITNDLLQHGVVPEELGGDVMIVPVSAKTGENLDKLKSSVLLLAEMLELRAPVGCRAQGIVIESRIERSCGIVATVIVQKGVLKKGNIIVAGDNAYGKVRNMFNDADVIVDSAPPSCPVRVLGLGAAPKAGDVFVVMPSEKRARALLEHRSDMNSSLEVENRKLIAVPALSAMCEKVEEVRMILKADVAGSLEAVSYSVAQLEHEEVKFNILYKDIGDVTKSDVLLAEASSAVILAFNVRVDAQARDLVRQKDVNVCHYRVIYDLIDDVKNMVGGKLKPIIQELQLGLLLVKQVFSSTKGGVVVGCYVSEGSISRGATVQVYRGGAVVSEGKVKILRRFKDDVKEVNYGLECGVLIEGVKGITVGDTIKVLERIERPRVLE